MSGYDKWRTTNPTDAQYCACGLYANDCWMDEDGHCDLADPPQDSGNPEDCPQEEEAPELAVKPEPKATIPKAKYPGREFGWLLWLP